MPVNTARKHGPLNTGSVYRALVFTGRVGKKALHDNAFYQHGPPVMGVIFGDP